MVTGLESLDVDLSVVLGKTRMPLNQLLRLGRGAVITLDATDHDLVDVLANGHLVAHGQVVVTGTTISVEITRMVTKSVVLREAGTRIDGGVLQLPGAPAA